MKEIKQDIENRNTKGYLHGYQEQYDTLNNLRVRCLAKNGLPVGYTEWQIDKETVFYIR